MQFINSVLVIFATVAVSSTIAQQEQGVRGQRGLQSGNGNGNGGGMGNGMMGNGNGNVDEDGNDNGNGNGMMGMMGMGGNSTATMGMLGMGMMGGRGSAIDPDTFVDSMCTADPCGLVGETTGVLVCRTVGERTFTKCIDSEESIEGDVCGCCDEECPEACTTGCENNRVVGGVLVEKTRRNGAVRSSCVSPLDSVTLLLKANTTCL